MRLTAFYWMMAGTLMIFVADSTFDLFTDDDERRMCQAIRYAGLFMLVASITWPYLLWR